MRRISTTWTQVSIASFLVLGAGVGCGAENDGDDIDNAAYSAIGDVLPGTNGEAFEEAADAFGEVEALEDGLGPIFNEAACGNCHTTPVMGGSGEQIERRFGTLDEDQLFAPLDGQGGSLRQLFTVGNFNNPNLPAASRGKCQPGNPTLCCVPLEIEPQQATIRNVGRRTTPLFGLGLVDAMPDSFFDQLAAAQPAAIRGIARRVMIALPDPRDRSQRIGSERVARFGWKAAVPGLTQFAGDAYVNEMGITTQSCFRGTSVLAFASESDPNGIPVPLGCDDLAPQNPAGNPHVPQFTDDAVGPCANGRTEIQDDLVLFTTFMERLAPPPRDMRDKEAVRRGDQLFNKIGCAGCHVRTAFKTPDTPFNRVPGNYTFRPFSDFLIHDMGSLGDGIGLIPGEPVALTRHMRTAPLWGARFNTRFLHDGRATTIGAAIRAHDGQGAAARNAFKALGDVDQHAVVQFVRSL